MKEEINLMPPAAKHARHVRLFQKRAKSIYASLIWALMLVLTGYGVVYGVFWYNQKSVQAELGAVKDASGPAKKTEEVNILLHFAKGRIVDVRPWSPAVTEVLQAAPGDIEITTIEVIGSEQMIKLSGRSNSRSAIVDFQRKLEELPWTKSVQSPLQNFASGPNVLFEFTLIRKQ